MGWATPVWQSGRSAAPVRVPVPDDAEHGALYFRQWTGFSHPGETWDPGDLRYFNIPITPKS